METMVQEITGVEVLTLHHDISTATGEEVILFTLAESPIPQCQEEIAFSGYTVVESRGTSYCLSTPSSGVQSRVLKRVPGHSIRNSS